ncbi:MAG: Conserved protein of unknown function, putative antitoxin [Microgenomates group bacterium Gr01-1014_7]|nr:MAG: Conserved protein of unknown function, putative antitoxin [Microgenomates group bacterium Gr01-1014_7]
MSTFVSISDARNNFPSLVDKVSKTMERVTITVHGQPAATLISQDELESILETAEILSIPGARESINTGLKQAKAGKGIPLSKLK